MTDIRKQASEHYELPNIKKSASNRKNDLFSEFEANRQVLYQEKDNITRTNAHNRKKEAPRYSNDDEQQYNEDFQPAQNLSAANIKRKTEADNSFSKKIQKNQQSKNKLVLERIGESKNISKHRTVKSVMETESENTNYQPGRYEQEVDKKFGILSLQSSGSDAIIKSSDLIREYIKKYNEILTDLINKNLAQLTSKKKKKVTPEEAIKILQQQIKNNAKIEQLDLNELTKLQEYKDKLEQQENYSQTNLEQEVLTINAKIKQKKKEIYDMKLAVQNQAKKLVPTGSASTTKFQSQSEVTSIKEKLLNLRRQFQKNQQKANGLQVRFNDLNKKIQGLGDIDKEADELRTSSKKNEDKNKKHLQVKKKYDSLKVHVSKTEALWNAKCSVISHQNESIKLKIKNVQLQVKNMEQQAKAIYEKSMKTLHTAKPKNEQNQKSLDKILEEMSSQNESLGNKQMSLSQMKMLTKKKPSVDQLPPSQADSKSNTEIKTKSQQSQRNRIWKEQNTKESKDEGGAKLNISKAGKSATKSPQVHQIQNQHGHDTKLEHDIKGTQMTEAPKNESKPKKFNFNKNKGNQQADTSEPVNQQDHKNVNENPGLGKTNEEKQKIHQKVQEIPKVEQQEIKPKRFNLNLRDRKSKEQSGSYVPSDAQTGVNPKSKENVGSQMKQPEKPAFNLKKKRDQDNNRQSIDNEFMGQ